MSPEHLAKLQAGRKPRKPRTKSLKHHYQSENINQKKLNSVSAYLFGIPASKKTAIRNIFRDRLTKMAVMQSKTFPKLIDEYRMILAQCCFEVADEIENKIEHPNDISRSIFDAMCDIEADIQVNRQAF
jgi:hypothetical protein